MSILQWFSKEAREERSRHRSEVKEAQRQDRMRSSAERLYDTLQKTEECDLVTFKDEVRKVREQCSPPADDASRDALLRLTALEAAAYLFLAENLVIIRQTTTDAYNLTYYPPTDRASWPEIAAVCSELVQDARKLQHGEEPEGRRNFWAALAERAAAVKILTPEALQAEGRDMPIWPHVQPGASAVGARFSTGALGMMATLSKKTKPTPRIRTVGDFKQALKDIPGSQWLSEVGR